MTAILFWALAALAVFSLTGYGLVWIALAALFGRRTLPSAGTPLHATMLIAARNEAANIRAKLDSVLAQDIGPHRLDILVVSDGSEDATLTEAQSTGNTRVSAFETAGHGGKASALNAGLARIEADVVIFSDANSILAPGALAALLDPFADPAVGGVCGRPEPASGGRNGWLARVEKLFWAYDSALKRAESRLGGAVSAQGTLYAMRRECLPPTVPRTVADDFYISVHAPAHGRRLVFAPDAVAREAVTQRTGAEFMRRVRSTERGWRALMSMAGLMNPARHGLYAIQLFCHKALRRLVAFVLPALFIVNIPLVETGAAYAAALALQSVFYAVALAALILPNAARLPGAGLVAFFVMGHAAMAFGILRAAFGVQSARWAPVRDPVP